MRTKQLRTLLWTLAIALSGLVFVPGNTGCGNNGGAIPPGNTDVVAPVTPAENVISAILTPADGTADVAPSAAITVVFQATIAEPADWTTAFVLQRDGAGDTVCTSVTYDAAALTATCAHDPLTGSASYTAKVSGITDVTDATAIFTIAKATAALTPADAATDVEPAGLVMAVFSTTIVEPADWTTAFVLQRNGAGASLCTAVTYDAATLIATCTHAPLIPGGIYTASLAGISSAIDAAASFTIRQTAVTFAPPDGATDIAPLTPITVQFGDVIDEPADWTTALVLQQDGVGANLCTGVTYDAATRTATCAHNAMLAGNHYTAAIIGVPGAQNAGATFTASNADKTILPMDGSTGLERDVAITVTFTNAIAEPADWTAAFVLQRDGAGLTLCTAVTYDAAARTATCAHAALTVGGSYTATVSGVAGVANGSASFTVRNTTVTLQPANGTWDLGVMTKITATFLDPIEEPADWNAVFILLKNDAGSTKCKSITYDAATLTATCTHSIVLDFLTQYVVKVEGMAGVTDASSKFSAFF